MDTKKENTYLQGIRRNKMPRKTTKSKTKKTTTKSIGKRPRKTTVRRKNIVGNFRGTEDIFWTKVIKGFKKLFSPAFPKQ
jgi:hypothetical protein